MFYRSGWLRCDVFISIGISGSVMCLSIWQVIGLCFVLVLGFDVRSYITILYYTHILFLLYLILYSSLPSKLFPCSPSFPSVLPISYLSSSVLSFSSVFLYNPHLKGNTHPVYTQQFILYVSGVQDPYLYSLQV